MSLLQKATCRVEVEVNKGTERERGTGFFISSNLILTSEHVIKDCDGSIEIFKCNKQNGSTLTAAVVDSCIDCDYALLQLNEEFDNKFILELCNSEIIEGESIKAFGFPDDQQGQDLGEPLNGTILMKADDDDVDSVQDVILTIEGFAPSTKYGGFSGSPVINEYNQVTSLIKYKAVRNLSSVSVKKALKFLEKNQIEVKPDQLQSFEGYRKSAFIGFEDRQGECEIESKNPLKKMSPKQIIDSNGGKLFYPEKPHVNGELIEFLRNFKDINSKLWKGWVQLLTYVEILKGDYENSNSMSIEISSTEFIKRFGVFNSSKNVNLKLYLNFYFTEEQSYFKIAQKSIHEKNKEGFVNHTCNIFNSTIEDFGNINKHIVDISTPEYSGPSISKLKIGALSLSQLNREVKSSNSLGEVTGNLKKIFNDAIK